MEEKSLHRRSIVIGFVFVALFSSLSARLIYVQGIEGSRYEKLASKQNVRRQIIHAYRGSILDRNGEPLARNKPSRTVFADMYHLKNFKIASRGLEYAEGLSREELRRKYDETEIRSHYLSLVAKTIWKPLGFRNEGAVYKKLRDDFDAGKSEIVLAKQVDEDTARDVQSMLKEREIRGVYFRSTMERKYPSKSLASHIIGFTDHEGIGREGVERTLNDFLAGEAGYRYIERDSAGREILAQRGDMKEPIHGSNISLTLDMRLQTIVEAELDAAIAEFRPKKATVIVMDPYTGEILAYTNRPTFNPNRLDGNAAKRRNTGITDIYDPGSTFKIVAVSRALDLGLVNLNTRIDCSGPGKHWEPGFRKPLADHRPLGVLPVRDIIALSSNIGTYKLCKQLGARRFYEHMVNFGFGTKTGIGMSGEVGGVVRNYKKWYAEDMSRMGMGYSVSVTPLQMICATSVIANGGELVRPRIIKTITDHSGRRVSEGQRHVVRRVVSSRAASDVRKAMARVVSDKGTAPKAVVEGYAVAGKTGTSKLAKPGLGYFSNRYVTSFIGFLPAENPRVSAIVVIHDPRHPTIKPTGGNVAAPVFARIMKQIMPVLGVEPVFTTSTSTSTGGQLN